MKSNVFDFENVNNQIVYPKYNTSYLVTMSLKQLQLQLKNSGISIPIVKDNAKSSDSEILVGKTKRSGNNAFNSEEEYIIKPVENKLVIDGGSVQAIIKAIEVLSGLINGGQIVFISPIKGRCDKSESCVCDYKLKLLEDFEGDTLNERWSPYTRESYPERYKNKEDGSINTCFRTEKNISVHDGKLYQKITLDDEHTLVGAKMTTADSFWFRYGYTEVSVKIASGFGTGSGFWLHGDNSKPNNKYCEFDILEIYGHPAFNRFSPICCVSGKEKNISAWYLGKYSRLDTRVWLENDEKLSDAYHTFGLEWDENYYRFTMDGEVVFENKYSDWENKEGITSYQQPVHAIISINGGNYDWKIVEPDSSEPDFSKNNWTDDNIYTVDYFFVYQKDNQFCGKTAEEILKTSNKYVKV